MPAIKEQEVAVSLKLKDERFKRQLIALREYLESLQGLYRDLGKRLQELSRQKRVDELFEIKTK